MVLDSTASPITKRAVGERSLIYLLPSLLYSMENEGGMVLGLLSIAISSVFAIAVGLVVLHFIPNTPL